MIKQFVTIETVLYVIWSFILLLTINYYCSYLLFFFLIYNDIGMKGKRKRWFWSYFIQCFTYVDKLNVTLFELPLQLTWRIMCEWAVCNSGPSWISRWCKIMKDAAQDWNEFYLTSPHPSTLNTKYCEIIILNT